MVKNTKPKTDKLTSEYQDLLDISKSRLIMARGFARNYHKEVKKWLKDYNIESFSEINSKSGSDLQNKLQIPYIFSTVESSLPSMFERMPKVSITQRGTKDEEFTEFTDKVWKYVTDKLRLEDKIEDGGFSFLTIGMMTAKYGWKIETEMVDQPKEVPILDPAGQQVSTQTITEQIEVPVVNEPFVKMKEYNRIWFSPESKFVFDDVENEIPYIICGELIGPDELEEQYKIDPEDINEDTYLDTDEWSDEKDLKGILKPDIKRFHVFEYSGILPKKESKDPSWKSSNIYRYSFMDSRLLSKPERISKKEFNLCGNYGDNVSFWRFGEPKILRELEQDVSLGRSTIMDYRDKMATKLAIPQETEVDEENLKSPKIFTLVRFAGSKFPAYINPPPIPEAVMTGLQMSKEDIQMTSAQLDISRGGTESMVDTATGQRMFGEAQQKRITRKRKKIANFIKYLARNILTLCATNWEVDKFAKITDYEPDIIEQSGFIDKLKSLGDEYDVEIEIEDMTNNQESQAAQAIALYRETKGDPLANGEEILKFVLKTGFNRQNPEKFLSGTVTPDMALKAIGFFVQNQLMSPETAQQLGIMVQQMAMQEQTGGKEGRPATQNPVGIVKKSMPGSDNNQISAQNAAAYKQTNVPKGPQNVR